MGARQKVRKASDSSLYREIELLMIWLIGVGDRIPKGSPTLLTTSKTLMETLADALTSCGGAYQLLTSLSGATISAHCSST